MRSDNSGDVELEGCEADVGGAVVVRAVVGLFDCAGALVAYWALCAW